MIGKFIKKLWKDWPEYEMTIKAEDLNKWEDAIKEHDERLEQLKDIDTDLNEANNKIKSLQNAAHASTEANNLVSSSEEEKRVGTGIGNINYKIMQRSKVFRTTEPDGSVAWGDAMNRGNGAYDCHLLDVKIGVSTNGPYGRQYTSSCGDVKIEHHYDPLTNGLIIDYKGLSYNNRIYVVIQYTQETA